MSRRSERVNDLLRELIAEIIARELKDPRLELDLLSVTEVQVSPDMRNARVLVSMLGSDEEQLAAVTALKTRLPLHPPPAEAAPLLKVDPLAALRAGRTAPP